MTIKKLNHKEEKLQIEELITELDKIESIEFKELYNITINCLFYTNISEIKQRYYL